MAGMSAERQAVVEAITAVGAQPVWFEEFGGMDDDPENAYLSYVASSSVFFGILGSRYGTPMKSSGYSPTHEEYREAERRGLRISMWTAAEGLDGRQRDFLNDVRVFRTTGTYTSPATLRSGVEKRLQTIAAETLAPWVKIANLMFRATSIQENGSELTIAARVRDAGVGAALDALRPQGAFGQHADVPVTWPSGTVLARVSSIANTTAVGAQDVTITAKVQQRPGRSTRFSVNGVSADDVTEATLRSMLFGEGTSVGLSGMSPQIANPLASLTGLSLPEDAYGQIARLVLTEELVGGVHAGRLLGVRVSPPRGGSRKLTLDWLPPREFSNVDPQPRSTTGEFTCT